MIIEEAKLDFDDVLIRPKRSTLVSRKDVDIIREFKLPNGETINGFPLIAANMDTTGTFAMNESLSKHHAFTALHKYYPIEDIKKHWKNNYGFLTFGMSEKDNERINQLEEVINEWTNPKICLDVANGYTEKFCNYVSKFRERFPNATIMAGNVCTPEMTEQLILSGADIVKVGVGPGSTCLTRVTTGVGYPQLSAIIECKDAAHGQNGLVCSDGGCRNAGDVCKAFGAGADFVMLGGIFGGTDECEGEWECDKIEIEKTRDVWYVDSYILNWNEGLPKPEVIKIDKENRRVLIRERYIETTKVKKSLTFYGMSSKEAQIKYNGELSQYRASEGKCVKLSYKGPAESVLLDIMGGVRSACAYVGARRLKDFNKCCSFVRVSRTHNTVYG